MSRSVGADCTYCAAHAVHLSMRASSASQDGLLKRQQLSSGVMERLHRMPEGDVRKVFKALFAIAEKSGGHLRAVRSSSILVCFTALWSLQHRSYANVWSSRAELDQMNARDCSNATIPENPQQSHVCTVHH